MLIGVQKRFVFIANSKTASTSIEAMFVAHAEIVRTGSPKRKHIGWSECRSEYAFLFDNPEYAPESFFRFGVVREPVEWVRSWYNYRNTSSRRIASRFKRETSFEQFWRGGDWVKGRTQKSRFVDADGSCGFDLIIPLERLGDGLAHVLRRLDVPASSLKKENKSKNAISRADIPAELITEINAFYDEDFRFWKQGAEQLERIIGPLPGDAPGVAAAATQTPAVLLRVEEPACAQVEFSRIEVAQLEQGAPGEATVRGVVVLRAACAGKSWKLVLQEPAGERVLEWDGDSPQLARRYPDNPCAASARFREFRLDMVKGETRELSVLAEDGERFVVARIKA